MATLTQYQIFKDEKKEWRWRLIGKNGEIVCQSEGYRRRGGAIAACKRMPQLAQTNIISEIVS